MITEEGVHSSDVLSAVDWAESFQHGGSAQMERALNSPGTVHTHVHSFTVHKSQLVDQS